MTTPPKMPRKEKWNARVSLFDRRVRGRRDRGPHRRGWRLAHDAAPRARLRRAAPRGRRRIGRRPRAHPVVPAAGHGARGRDGHRPRRADHARRGPRPRLPGQRELVVAREPPRRIAARDSRRKPSRRPHSREVPAHFARRSAAPRGHEAGDALMYRYDSYDPALVAERVAQFRDQTRRYLAGELSDDEFRPLRLQNGLSIQRHAPMLRLAVPYGLLSSVQLRMLARIARDHG